MTTNQPEWEKEFDEKTDLEDHSGNFKWLQEESLFGDDKHPESDYELSAEKIKDFIHSLLASQHAELREKIEGMKKKELDVIGQLPYNQAIDDQIPHLKELLVTLKR